jgi:hypothetical protein
MIGDTVSRFFYVLFFGFATYNINLGVDRWFTLVGLGTILLFADEIISHMFRSTHRKRLIEDCARAVLEELKLMELGVEYGKHK